MIDRNVLLRWEGLSRAGSAVVQSELAVEGEDELLDGSDGGSVEAGGVEAPGFHGGEDDLVEIIAESLDELFVGDVADGADADVNDDLFLRSGKERAISDSRTRVIGGEGRLGVVVARTGAEGLLLLLLRGCASLGEMVLRGRGWLLRGGGPLGALRIFDAG